MPFDSLVLSAVSSELQEALLNDRVNTVQQPDTLTVALTFARKERLLLSAHPEYARVHLSRARLPKLPQPPGFCMLLRKYIEGSRLRTIRQPHFDRVLELEFTCGEEPVWLVAELMGRHSNLFLRSHDGIILGTIKLVPASVNRIRVTSAGSPYMPPPAGGRASPLEGSPEEAAAWLLDGEMGKNLRAQMAGRWTGTSPVLIDWLCQQVQLDPNGPPFPSQREPLMQALIALRGMINASSYSPNGSVRQDKPDEDVWALSFPYPTVTTTPFPTMSAAVESVFGSRIETHWLQDERAQAAGRVKSLMAKESRKLEDFRRVIAEAEEAPLLRRMGGALLTYAPTLAAGVDHVTLLDPAAEGESLAIPLDPDMNPVENAERLFKRARHAERAAGQVEERAVESEKRLEALRKQAGAVIAAEDRDQISRLMAESLAGTSHRSGVLPVPPSAKPARKDAAAAMPSGIRRVIAPSGHEIMYGRNSSDNDYLTTRVARPNDWWFHVRGDSSAHVIIRTNNQPDRVPQETLMEAANVAAIHSAAKHSSYVPVDYTLRKYVVKRRGSAPGMVEYRGEKTLHVQPRIGE